MPLPRPCANKKCGKRFQPETRANKLCDDCREKSNDWRKKKIAKYNKLYIYNRRCKRCDKTYETKARGSQVCLNCDLRKNRKRSEK